MVKEVVLSVLTVVTDGTLLLISLTFLRNE